MQLLWYRDEDKILVNSAEYDAAHQPKGFFCTDLHDDRVLELKTYLFVLRPPQH